MTPGTRAAAGGAERTALIVIQVGAAAVVLAALPYKSFDLDRFFVPKELVLHFTAAAAALVLLARSASFALGRVDLLLGGYLLLSLASAAAATNRWVALRSLAIGAAGIALFWSARVLRRAGLARPLLAGVALAAVVGAGTALLQAYGVESEYVSLNRAPGGTFGNRNFMAHLAAIGAPVLLLLLLTASRPAGALLGSLGMLVLGAALLMSRTRAAWLGLAAGGIVALPAAWLARRALADPRVRRRLLAAGGAAALGALGALVVPNRLEWKSDSPYLESVRGVVNYREGSGRGRLIQYGNTFRMALAHPVLGVGPGNWPVVYPRFAKPNDPSIDRDDGMTSNPWPSSDWLAIVSERGLPAAALLALALVGLAAAYLSELRATPAGGTRVDERLYPIAAGAVLAITMVVGAFDAVLLLAPPSLLVWSTLGALAPPTRFRWAERAGGAARRWAAGGAAAIALVAALKSAGQARAMALVESSRRTAVLERAAALDPGSYRIHLRLAQASRGRCDRVKRWAGRASALFPNAPEPRRMLRACGVKK